MDFEYSAKVQELREQLTDFMETRVYPAESVFHEQVSANRWAQPQILEDLKAEARQRGLWNLFSPSKEHGAGLTNLDYAPLAEIMGRSIELAPEACNCA